MSPTGVSNYLYAKVKRDFVYAKEYNLNSSVRIESPTISLYLTLDYLPNLNQVTHYSICLKIIVSKILNHFRKGPKKIFGVPVIPGLPSMPIIIDPSSDGDDISDSPSVHRKRTASTSSAPSSPRLPWTLGHKDFLPRQIKEKNEEGFEQFKYVWYMIE